MAGTTFAGTVTYCEFTGAGVTITGAGVTKTGEGVTVTGAGVTNTGAGVTAFVGGGVGRRKNCGSHGRPTSVTLSLIKHP